jgi:nicotinate phosphoribosyltransferase
MDPLTSPLLTDLYQLTMLQADLHSGLTGTASFEFFCRKLPARRGFLLAAGLQAAVEFLENLKFSEQELDFLRKEPRFSSQLLDYLGTLRFTGDVDAMPEGTPFFADEPILRVTAPLPQAQLVETRLINIVHLHSLIASKAARLVLAADGRTLVDFGLRRAHGAEAGLAAARAAYLAGFAGTATVLALPLLGIPIFGTMAHAFIQAHASEEAAFASFARTHPANPVLLIDTYDTLSGAAKVVALAPRLAAEGIRIRAVRLDSGDLGQLARAVRRILDRGGLTHVKIFVSGGLDEDRIGGLLGEGAPIDGFGVGTSLVTSEDAPAFDCAYKLQEYEGIPRRKRSEGKATWPGRKQVFRRFAADGTMAGDTITVAGEWADGQALLEPVLREGRRVAVLPDLEGIRRFTADQIRRLPDALRRLGTRPPYPVTVAPALHRLADEADRRTETASS